MELDLEEQFSSIMNRYQDNNIQTRTINQDAREAITGAQNRVADRLSLSDGNGAATAHQLLNVLDQMKVATESLFIRSGNDPDSEQALMDLAVIADYLAADLAAG
jgi:hypothetical protein